MKVEELTRDQLIQLKQRMLCEEYDERGESPGYAVLAEADGIVEDGRVMDMYKGTEFSPEDFD